MRREPKTTKTFIWDKKLLQFVDYNPDIGLNVGDIIRVEFYYD